MVPAFAADGWPAAVEAALAKAKDNRPELERALRDAPPDQRPGMEFLVANMPDKDLTTLKADFLLTNTKLAYRARAEFPWGKDVPEKVFFNDVLPYANVDEKRDAWRQEMYDLCQPIAKECKTPTEVTQRLNKELFKKLKVGYSTERRAANQSPSESRESGKASCTGLSILLSDACRSVGIPARLVGTPRWATKNGNHTWIEIWDKDWHFTGACEPDPNGLDRGWFVADAAAAIKGDAQKAIYAASFEKGKRHFPMVWSRRDTSVPGLEVTDRYAKAKEKAETVRVFVRVVGENKKRVAVPVVVTPDGDDKTKFEGTSKGESADTNDFLTFELKPGQKYTVKVGEATKTFTAGEAGKQQTVEITIK
jgi:transglutaminase-like putative cysteine protease